MLLSYALAATALVVPALSQTIEGGAPPARPNVVLVLVDDQDARQDSISSMNKVQELLVKEGTQFSHFYAPSKRLLHCEGVGEADMIRLVRPSLRLLPFEVQSTPSSSCTQHQHYKRHCTVRRVEGVQREGVQWTVRVAPENCREAELTPSRCSYLPSFLQEAGYGTYYVGKLMNDHSVANFDTLPPQGWTGTLACPLSRSQRGPLSRASITSCGLPYRPQHVQLLERQLLPRQ